MPRKSNVSNTFTKTKKNLGIKLTMPESQEHVNFWNNFGLEMEESFKGKEPIGDMRKYTQWVQKMLRWGRNMLDWSDQQWDTHKAGQRYGEIRQKGDSGISPIGQILKKIGKDGKNN